MPFLASGQYMFQLAYVFVKVTRRGWVTLCVFVCMHPVASGHLDSIKSDARFHGPAGNLSLFHRHDLYNQAAEKLHFVWHLLVQLGCPAYLHMYTNSSLHVNTAWIAWLIRLTNAQQNAHLHLRNWMCLHRLTLLLKCCFGVYMCEVGGWLYVCVCKW